MHVREAAPAQLTRHTRARVLVLSGAVGEHGAVARHRRGMALHVVRRHADGPRDLRVRLAPGFGAAGVHDGQGLAPGHPLADLVDGDARDFLFSILCHRRSLQGSPTAASPQPEKAIVATSRPWRARRRGRGVWAARTLHSNRGVHRTTSAPGRCTVNLRASIATLAMLGLGTGTLSAQYASPS